VSQPTTTPDTEMTNPAMESNQYEDVAGRLIAQQDRQIVVVQEIEQPAIGAGATVISPAISPVAGSMNRDSLSACAAMR
jgi:hypothetical protein